MTDELALRELDDLIDEELTSETAPLEPLNTLVTIGGREFDLDIPSTGIVLRIIRSISKMGMRGERIALRSLSGIRSSATITMTLFGVFAAMQPADLCEIGAALLQFQDEKEGRKFLKDLGDDLKIAPLIKAAFINIELSDDLVEIVQNFFDGLARLQQSNLIASLKTNWLIEDDLPSSTE
ncbi:MAG: hypothetical protein DRP52_01665 [Planctomycetota bacterium]|nr:MAG: hypothetical protein DRP52_01665 [Planctomycetota bacterium]RLC83041.1 MAG: hypothetical protein DRJ03_18140 [Chloroflexota bacterium]